MLTLHPTTSPTTLFAATPANPSAGTPAEGSGQPSAFARMLQGSQPPAAAPTTQPAPKHDTQDAATRPHEAHAEPRRDTATQAPASSKAPAAQHPAATREAPRGRDDAKRTAAAKAPAHPATQDAKAAKDAKDAKAAKAAKADGDDDTTAAADARDAATAAQDPALASWLANLKLPDAQQPALPTGGPATADAKADAAAAQAATANATAASCTPGTAQPAADSAAAQAAAGQAAVAALAGGTALPDAKPAPAAPAAGTGRERAVDAATRGAEAAESSGATLAAAVRARAEQGDAQAGAGGQGDAGKAPAGWTPVSSASAAVALPDAAMPMQAANLAADAARHGAEPVTVRLPTPVDSPEFPRAMGIELAVLARDGVEQAELHLTPADMGPVSVQIAIDGTQARIDFGADMASTRQAIEAGLPELASALRDAGLTLTGGGVSQHSRGRSDTGDAQGTGPGRGIFGGAGDDAAPLAAAAPARRFVRAGGVDMYA